MKVRKSKKLFKKFFQNKQDKFQIEQDYPKPS